MCLRPNQAGGDEVSELRTVNKSLLLYSLLPFQWRDVGPAI